MKNLFIKCIVLCIGIGGGIYVSSKLGVLEEVIDEYNIKDDYSINAFEVNEDDLYPNELVLVNRDYNGFIIDLQYATTNNITGEILYDEDLVYLQKNTLEKLKQVNEELRIQGYKLKIWDAYRPLSVQKKLWAAYPNPSFIANPFTTGSNHNRGAAVDVTLVNLDGSNVKMPTGFDEFGSKCRRETIWKSDITKNVDLLTETMEKCGFTSINSEWWHFDDEDAKKYPIMDYKFRDLIKK